jgi:hypothetical protein
MALLPYQMQYNGYTIGAYADALLAPGGLNGFRGMPVVRVADMTRARRHGSFPGMMYYASRIVTIDMEVWGNLIPSGQTIEQVISATTAAFQLIVDPSKQLPLSVMLPSWSEPRILFCRTTKFDVPVDEDYNYNKPSMHAEMTASDPLIYSNTLHSVSASLPSPTAGARFPVTFPLSFGASTGGSAQAANAGNHDTPFVVTLTGPMQNPKITIGSAFFGLNLTLSNTDTVVIDMNLRTVTLNGTASRANAVATGSAWLSLPAAATTTIGVQSSDATQVTGLFNFQWRDAWGNL